MPIYGYECDNCGHHFEVMQKVTDERLTECPDCHKPTLRKRLYPVGVVFKGSGFYSTDYKGKSSSSSTSSSSESKSESKSDSKSETKSETKSESKSESGSSSSSD